MEPKQSEVVVITGASAGVGRATAIAFAQQGARIGLLARGRDGLEAAQRDDRLWLTYIELQCIKVLRMDMSKDLVAASATPLVLAILAEGESYGYAIIKRVAELSGGRLQWTDGMLYPVLHRLERQGHVAAKWAAAETGRKRKYYRITREGRAQLAAQRQQWQAVDDTLRGIWMEACTA